MLLLAYCPLCCICRYNGYTVVQYCLNIYFTLGIFAMKCHYCKSIGITLNVICNEMSLVSVLAAHRKYLLCNSEIFLLKIYVIFAKDSSILCQYWAIYNQDIPIPNNIGPILYCSQTILSSLKRLWFGY